MKNELKLNMIEQIEEIKLRYEKIKEVLFSKLPEMTGNGLISDVSHKQNKAKVETYIEIEPLTAALEGEIKNLLSHAKGIEKEELETCIEHMSVFHRKYRHDHYIEAVYRMDHFKEYLEGLEMDDEQLHREATKSGSSVESGKKTTDKEGSVIKA